jgi:hypothetical protein
MSPDEAKGIVDKFAAADSSLAAIAAIAKQLIDQVAADAVRLAECERKRVYRARIKTVPDKCLGHVPDSVPDTASARARSSLILESKILGGGGGDTRARDLQNISAEELADQVESMVKQNGHWSSNWLHSATVVQIERRLRLGQRPELILDAVNLALKNGIAVGQPIHSFSYFDQPIARAHSEANREPTLPLDGTAISATRGKGNGDEHLRRRIEKSKQKPQADRDGSPRADATAARPMDAAEGA